MNTIAFFGLIAILATSDAVLAESVTEATPSNIEPSIEYEISGGKITFFFQNINPAEIIATEFDGKAIDIWHSDKFSTEYVGNGLVVHFNRQVGLSGSGVILVTLADGRKLQKHILGGPIPSLDWMMAASCSTAPAIYDAVQCDSTKSDVGTPPYPCCDNDGDRKATSSTDGNCAWYAWYKAKKSKGWTVPRDWGGANKWCANAAKTSGWKVSSTPSTNTIACSSSLGHVGWVTSVSGDKKTITLEEQNCKVSPYCTGTGTRSKSYSSSSFQYISK